MQLLKIFPTSYGTRRFITAFTIAIHMSLFWARSIQCISPLTVSPRYILIMFSHVHLGLPSGLFWLSHQYPVCILLPHSCYIPCSSHPPWLGHSNYTWRRVQVMKLLIMRFRYRDISAKIPSHWTRFCATSILFLNSYYPKIHLNVILLPVPLSQSSKWSFSNTFPDQNSCAFLVSPS
jgi:hypothetical protein